MELYSHIELDEIEIEEALRLAREAKHYLLKKIEYNQKLNESPEPKKYTWEQMFNAFKSQFKVDSDNAALVENLAKYFAGDASTSLDHKKGLLLIGGVGVGKTTLIRFFQWNQKRSYRIVSCRDVEIEYSTKGDEMVRYYSNNHGTPEWQNIFRQNFMGYCFDDLGTEANGKHYGKDKNAMAEIILNRYDKGTDNTTTHITTNLTASELKEQYGSRVTDRLREMMNIITFPTTAKSRRI